MKAIVMTGIGPPDVLHVQKVKKPVQMNDEVLVKVRAATVFAVD